MRILLAMLILLLLGSCRPEIQNSKAEIVLTETRAAPEPHPGEDLFEGNCRSCHAIDKDLTGPALHGVTKRRNWDWLYAFTRNSMSVIKSGDEYAIRLHKKWSSLMPPFPHLDSMEIVQIYGYIEAASKK